MIIKISKLYNLLGVHIYKYDRNVEILSTIKNENILCIVLSGYVQIIYIEYNGNEIVIENLYKNDVFGTNISGTNNEDFQIFTKEPSEILIIDYNKLLNPNNLKYTYFNTFFRNLFNIINIKFRQKNERIKILEKKQIRDKLLEYFDIEYKKNNSKYFNLSISLKDLADYIAVNRSAMFRELRHLKDDKLIEIKDKRIHLLYK